MQNADGAPPAWFDRVLEFLATGAGLGRLPGAPGTYGSVWGLALAWAAAPLGEWVRMAAAAGCFLAGIPLCHRVAARWNQTDPCAIVWDEIAAVPFLFLLTPFTARNAVVGFILFRLFDTVKPWPVRRFEKLHGGLGIMADDLAAALGSAVVLWVVHLNWP
jgi:phosphatidylglycerophosphatase A